MPEGFGLHPEVDFLPELNRRELALPFMEDTEEDPADIDPHMEHEAIGLAGIILPPTVATSYVLVCTSTVTRHAYVFVLHCPLPSYHLYARH